MRITDDFYKAFPKDNEFRKAAIELLEASEQPDYNPEGEKTHDSHDVPCSVYGVWEGKDPNEIRYDKNHRANTDRNNHHDLIIRDHIRLHWLLMFCCADELKEVVVGAYSAVVQYNGKYSCLSSEEKQIADKLNSENQSKAVSRYFENLSNEEYEALCRRNKDAKWTEESVQYRKARRRRYDSYKSNGGKLEWIQWLNFGQPDFKIDNEDVISENFRNARYTEDVFAKISSHYHDEVWLATVGKERSKKLSARAKESHNTAEHKKKYGSNFIKANLHTPEATKKRQERLEKERAGFAEYKSNGGTMCWNDWRHYKQPKFPLDNEKEINESATGLAAINKFRKTEEGRKEVGKKMSNFYSNPANRSKQSTVQKSLGKVYEQYKSNGGTLKWNAWKHAGRPAHD